MIWGRDEAGAVDADCNIPPFLSIIIYHFVCFASTSFVLIYRGNEGCDMRISYFWCYLVMLIATSHHFCLAECVMSLKNASPLLFFGVRSWSLLCKASSSTYLDETASVQEIDCDCCQTQTWIIGIFLPLLVCSGLIRAQVELSHALYLLTLCSALILGIQMLSHNNWTFFLRQKPFVTHCLL